MSNAPWAIAISKIHIISNDMATGGNVICQSPGFTNSMER
jgi:hypothetical protein